MNTGNDFHTKDEIVDKKIISDDKQERFKKTAMAMKEIITKKLYKNKYPTMEQYFKEVFKLSRASVYRFVDASRVLTQLEGFSVLPCGERQCRTLRRCTKDQKMVQILWKSVLEIYGNDTTLITSTIIQNTWEDLIKKGIVTPNKTNHTTRTRKRKNATNSSSNVTASNSTNSNSSSSCNNNVNAKNNNKNSSGRNSTVLKTNNFTSATSSTSQSSSMINTSYSYQPNTSINYYYNMIYPEHIDSNYYIQMDSINNNEPATYISPTPQTQYQNINTEAYTPQGMDCNWYNNQMSFMSGTQNPYEIQNINSSLINQKHDLNYNIQYVIDPNHETYQNQIFEYPSQIMPPHQKYELLN
ncbi:hypothetical protein BCR32DRAFT_326817 [Anaeromyces robustus]|uniref:Uncharacterized protein n=1 Tax=Anaeromyces robustus TaxID=1754192 RepID=A0A1Y1XAP5_9FUNG|nr:hypothetical protein BCR32DRAFT_326817 [Anaeromyces robustus]|eukprot:ORX82506.1 hypothetical protein BCR32DRAFT_326817 [Anaeromyces robustus]